jgi:imidazolonepropionase-like amidohydrolase
MADDNRYNLAPPWEKKRLLAARDAAIHSDQTANEDRVMKEEATLKGVLERKGMYIGGTDSPLDLPSTSLHLNILSQVKFGLAPWQALETVTSTAAKAAKVDKDLGLLAPGYLADLILVEGDPLTNIKDVTKVQCVMKNGQIHSVGELMAPFVKSDVGVALCPVK